MEMCAAAERGETRKAPPRAQNRHEEEPSAMEKNLVLLSAPREGTVPTPAELDAAPGGAADGDGHGEVVAAERREPRDATPPCVRVAMGDSTLPPGGQRTEADTKKSWPPNSTPRGGSLLQPPLLRNGRSEERVRVSW